MMSELLKGEIQKAWPGWDWLCPTCEWYIWRAKHEDCEKDMNEHNWKTHGWKLADD